jgi:hypothetical protein
MGEKREWWRRKNSFYHSYTRRFISFLVPEGVKTLFINHPLQEVRGTGTDFDYVVLSDALGYVHDIEESLREACDVLKPDGRLVITQYNEMWEPILRIASSLRLRMPSVEQNWLSRIDLNNSVNLAGFEVIRSGSKMLVPKYIPLISAFFNRFVVNLWPFSRLGLCRYVVARKLGSHTPHKNPSLSIIVPARNEAGTIQKIANDLPALGEFTEVIFIEGHSSDNTLEEIKRVVAEYKGNKKLSYAVQDGKGKGDAVRKGFDMANGDILAIYDADMTVPAEEVSKFYRALIANVAEFANGSRLIYPREKQAMRLLNFFGNKFFSFAFSYIIGQSIKDTLCGTKVLWRKDYKDIQKNRAFFGDFDPFGDFDLLFGAVKLNRKIMDIPVHYRDRVYGTTNISRWKHGWLLLQMTMFAARKLKFI